MLVPFFDAQKACEAVTAIFKKGITPSGLEFMEREALLWTQDFLQDTSIEVAENHAAHLLIEVDGFEQEILMESSTLTAEGYLYYAEILIDKLIILKPESSNYNYRKGYLILDSRSDYEKAMPYLEKAILDMDKNYDMFSAREESAPQDALYYLAKSHHLNEDIPKAREFYTKFIENSAKKSSLIEMAQLGTLHILRQRKFVTLVTSWTQVNLNILQ